MTDTAQKKSFNSKTIGFFLGIIVFLVVWFAGIPGLDPVGSHATAIALLTAIWWIFMCMPPMIPALCACVLFLVTNTDPRPRLLPVLLTQPYGFYSLPWLSLKEWKPPALENGLPR